MPILYNWYLRTAWDDESVIQAHGLVSGREKIPDGLDVHTTRIQEAVVADGALQLTTRSGQHYTLAKEAILPDPDRGEGTAACLAAFGIEAGFVEECLRARAEAEQRRREEDQGELEPGELLLACVGTRVIQALFCTPQGEVVGIEPTVHLGTYQDSVLVTDWKGGTVDFRYFPKTCLMEPYHVSDGLETIKVRNLGARDVYFGKSERQVTCPAGQLTAIPAAEHDHEGLFSPDAVNGKNVFTKHPPLI